MTLVSFLQSRRGMSAQLAASTGINAVLLSQWSNGQRPVPMERCIEIERATCGFVTCEELRPDLAELFAYLRHRRPLSSAKAA